jgi:hypothetical protein
MRFSPGDAPRGQSCSPCCGPERQKPCHSANSLNREPTLKPRYLRCISLSLCLLLVLPTATLGASKKENGVQFPMKYEGGSLALDQHDSLKAFVSNDEVVIVQNKQRFAVPVTNITEISYGNDVHRRVGAAVGVGIVTLGIGALLLLVKTKKHYVGMVWNDNNATGNAPKGGVVFKVGKGEYRGFMTALEGVTGKKAVNADAVGSGGTAKP